MNNRPIKPGNLKPKVGANAVNNSRQELRARLGSHLLGTTSPQKRSASMAAGAAKRAKVDFRNVASVNPAVVLGSATSSSSGNMVSSSAAASSSIATPKLFPVDTTWKEFSGDIEVNKKNFESIIAGALDKNKLNRMARTVCGAVKFILNIGDVNMMDKDFINLVIKTIKEDERLMKNNNVFVSLFALMSELNGGTVTGQVNAIITLLTTMCNTIENWPLAVVSYALNDSIGPRLWVDRPIASHLLQCVCSIFGPLTFPSEEVCNSCELPYVHRERFEGPSKFNNSADDITALVNLIRDHFEKRVDPSKNALKTLSSCSANEELRLLSAQKLDNWLQNGKLQRQAMELLLFIAANLHDSFSDANMETLMCLVRLRALRSKQIMNVFQFALRDILSHCPGATSVMISMIMENEYSPMKFQHNMNILQLIYNYNNAEASDIIARNLIKRLENPDSARAVRAFLRDFVRSIIRTEFSFSTFARAMFNAFKATVNQISQHLQDILFRSFVDVCALLPFIAITPLVKESAQIWRSVGGVGSSAASPASVQVAASTVGNALSTIQQESLSKFYAQLNAFMVSAVEFLKWCGRLIAVNTKDYLRSFYTLLYIGNHSHYTSIEMWPSEMEYNQFIKVISECSVDEAFFIELLDAGSTQPVQRLSLSNSEVITILESITRRALSVRGFETCDGKSLVVINSPKVIEQLFTLTIHPLSLEDGNGSDWKPRLATRNLYWKAWFLTAIWTCLNRNTLLKGLYEKFPILRMLFYMAITKDYHFPLLRMDGRSAEVIAEIDEQELVAEHQLFASLSGVRSASAGDSGGGNELLTLISVDDNNSSSNDSSQTGGLASGGGQPGNQQTSAPSTCFFNLTSYPRRPTNHCLECLRLCNDQFDMQFVLCSLRSPDILRHILRDQGADRVVGPVTQMALANPSAIESAIPLQCLCQLMIQFVQQKVGDGAMKSGSSVSITGGGHSASPSFPPYIQSAITKRLSRDLLHSKVKEESTSSKKESSNVGSAFEQTYPTRIIIGYILEKMGSPIFIEREAAVFVLEKLLANISSRATAAAAATDETMDMSNNNDGDDVSYLFRDDEEVEHNGSSSPFTGGGSGGAGKAFSVWWLVDIDRFSELCDEICEALAKCCNVENNAMRLVDYIKFVSQHAGDGVLHTIASRLSSLVRRTTDELSAEHKSVRDALTHFYAVYINRLERKGGRLAATADVFGGLSATSNLIVPDADALHIIIADPPIELMIDSHIVSAIMELLSEAFCGGDGMTALNEDIRRRLAERRFDENSEYLMKIFFPKATMDGGGAGRATKRPHLLVTKALNRNESVDILPQHLKMKMLSAHDERIVKVALDGVGTRQALDFLQSFALSSFSCTQLLSILNEKSTAADDDASTLAQWKAAGISTEQARAAVPFVRAYWLKGANASGCDAFLRRVGVLCGTDTLTMDRPQTSRGRMRLFSCHKAVVEPSPYSVLVEDLHQFNDFSSPTLATAYLSMLISRVKIDDNSSESSSSSTDFKKTKTFTKRPARDENESLSTNSSADEEIVLSQSFHQFLAALESKICVGSGSSPLKTASGGKSLVAKTTESIQYAKVVVAFVAQKVQLFVQLLPNTLVSILLVLMVAATKNVAIRSLLINLTERLERICPKADFISALLYRFHTKRYDPFGSPTASSVLKRSGSGKAGGGAFKLRVSAHTENGGALADYSTELIANIVAGRLDLCDILRRLTQLFAESKLNEVQIGNCLERYYVLHPQIFTAANTVNTSESGHEPAPSFTAEVRALFATKCGTIPPLADLIARITMHGSVRIIRAVMRVLLASFDESLCASAVVTFVENACHGNGGNASASASAIALPPARAVTPTGAQCCALFDYVLDEASRVLDNNGADGVKPPTEKSALRRTLSLTFADAGGASLTSHNSAFTPSKTEGPPPAFCSLVEQFVRVLAHTTSTRGAPLANGDTATSVLASARAKITRERDALCEAITETAKRRRLRVVDAIAAAVTEKFH